MGKQPDARPQFLWARIRPGYYWVTVEKVTYTVARLAPRRWELTGTAGAATVVSTLGESLHELRYQARRFHLSHRAHLCGDITRGPKPVAVTIPEPILSGLNLRRAQFTLTHEGNGWLAAYAVVPPGRPGTRLVTFKPTPATALEHLGVAVGAALAPGGELHTEWVESCGP